MGPGLAAAGLGSFLDNCYSWLAGAPTPRAHVAYLPGSQTLKRQELFNKLLKLEEQGWRGDAGGAEQWGDPTPALWLCATSL